MITQIFKYRKLHITLGKEKVCINIPLYNTTYLAMDPSGQIFTYNDKPVFDKSLNHYIIDENHVYDLVAEYSGDTSKFFKNVIAILDKQYEYSFMET